MHCIVMVNAGFDPWEDITVSNVLDRVFAETEAIGFCHINDRLDALSEPFRSLVFLGPDSRQSHQHLRLADAVDWHPTNLRKGVVAQSI